MDGRWAECHDIRLAEKLGQWPVGILGGLAYVDAVGRYWVSHNWAARVLDPRAGSGLCMHVEGEPVTKGVWPAGSHRHGDEW
jgi:hypothetical protein